MWKKLALLAASLGTGYLSKKIYNKHKAPLLKPQDVEEDRFVKDVSDNPEPAAVINPVSITDPAAVAALKQIYETNGPGELNWDISVDGQVIAKDGRVEASEGALISLNLSGVPLHGVLTLCDVETLRVLNANRCNLAGIDCKNLPGLKELGLNYNFIVDIGSLAELRSLTDLGLRRQSGDSCGNGGLKDLSPLAGLTDLTKLVVSSNEISDLSPLAGLTTLTELDVWSNYCISDLSPLAELESLMRLNVSSNNIGDLSPLAGLTNLTELSASGQRCGEISDLSPLANLTSLTKLSLSGKKISTLSPLAGLTKLTEFKVYDSVFSDLSPLAGMSNLTELQIHSSKVSDISHLAWLTSLRKLDVAHCSIINLGPLAGLIHLSELDVSGNEVIDLRPLSGLTNLTKLDIGYNMIRDFSPLGELKQLVSEENFTDQRQETKEVIYARAEKKARERKIGKCPNCNRVIRYPDIEAWEAFVIPTGCSAPTYRKSGNCPGCGQAITVQGMGSCLVAIPYSRIPWKVVTKGVFNGIFSGWFG